MGSIDVVVTCYQYGRFLRQSAGSVLAQSVPDLRLLIVDNGSTDNTLEVAQEIGAGNSRVEIATLKTNRGQPAGCNVGIEWARADYLMLLDADDLIAPGCLGRAMSILDQDRTIAFCHGVERRLSTDGMISTEGFDRSLDAPWQTLSGVEFIKDACSKGYNTVAHPTAVRRTDVQKAMGYYNLDLRYASDMNMWLRLATRGNVAETSAVQGVRRVHSGQMTQPFRERPVMDLVEHLNNFEHFFRHQGAGLSCARTERTRVTRRIAYNGLYMAASLILDGRLKQSAPCVRFSMATYARLLAEFLTARRGGHSLQIPEAS